ncbi:MAG: caspase family protein [Leptolyngbyaceae cyanobacterium MO_188.B28]|nr:caspase family protein [Leptolyngbyaceae cyanobacterium MO_188.B28]
MNNHWAIIIGINHYQSFQSLKYAQRDASELRQFLVKEVGLDSQRCVLLSEVSPAIEDAAVYPGREEIQTWIQQICQEILDGDDLLWFYFSGYGLHFEGQDYIAPIDCDPEHIHETALSIQFLFELFKQAPTDNILTVIDFNRSQSALPDQKIGAQTIELAKDFGIPTLLSCHPDQFSHETLGVRHGLFTVALLEGMRHHGCVTLSHLAEYVSDRVPELSEHHCRPKQTPVAVIPPEKKFLMVIPPDAMTRLPMTEAASARIGDASFNLEADIPSSQKKLSQVLPHPKQFPTTAPDSLRMDDTEWGKAKSSDAAANQRVKLRTWGILAAITVFLAIFYWKSPLFQSAQDGANPSSSPTPSNQPSTIGEETRVDEAVSLTTGPISEEGGTFSAMRPSPENLTEAGSAGNVEAKNRAFLKDARSSIHPIQASQFSDAIAQARRIQPGEPLYAQAQQDIDRWSRVILDLAEGRAANGNFAAALAAAKLVPSDRLEVYQLAQAQIKRWEQRQENRRILQEARTLPQEGQASSFHDAIVLVGKIAQDQPEYPMAQQLANRWSQDILRIARARAALERFPEAILAAELVPQTTSAYSEAQAAIQRWNKE